MNFDMKRRFEGAIGAAFAAIGVGNVVLGWDISSSATICGFLGAGLVVLGMSFIFERP